MMLMSSVPAGKVVSSPAAESRRRGSSGPRLRSRCPRRYTRACHKVYISIVLRLAIAQTASPQGRLRREPLPARRALPRGVGMGRAARAARGARNRPHRLLPRGRGPGSRHPGRAAFRRPRAAAPGSQGRAARRRPRLLRDPPQPPLQLRPLRHARRTRRRDPACAPQGVPADLRRLRRGALRRGGPERVEAFDTRWGRAAILICEDAWHSFTPMLAALGGAQLIIIPSASPARGVVTTDDTAGRPTSLARWSRIVQDIAGEHGVFVALSQLVGFEGGKAFPGGSIVAESARRRARRGPDLRGGADARHPRLRGDHPRPRRPAAAGRSGDAAAPSARLAPRGAALGRRVKAVTAERRTSRRGTLGLAHRRSRPDAAVWPAFIRPATRSRSTRS